MSLYLVHFDSEIYPVQAETFGAAVKAWQRHWAGLDPAEPVTADTEEPDQVVLVTDNHVINASCLCCSAGNGCVETACLCDEVKR